MHMFSRKDLNSAELETAKVSESPTTVVTANGRSANKRRSDRESQRFGLVRDSKASRRYTASSFTRNTLRGSRVQLPLDQRSETTSHHKWQEDQLQHSELRTPRCPWSVDKFFNFIFTYFSDIFIAGSRNSYGASRINKKWEYEWGSTGKPVRMDQQKPKNSNTNDDNEEVQGNLSHDLPEWLQESRHGLVNESVPEHRDASSSSHELLSEPRAKVVLGKHSIFTHFPEIAVSAWWPR